MRPEYDDAIAALERLTKAELRHLELYDLRPIKAAAKRHPGPANGMPVALPGEHEAMQNRPDDSPT